MDPILLFLLRHRCLCQLQHKSYCCRVTYLNIKSMYVQDECVCVVWALRWERWVVHLSLHFSGWKLLHFDSKLHRNVFPYVEFATNSVSSHYLNQNGLIYWGTYFTRSGLANQIIWHVRTSTLVSNWGMPYVLRNIIKQSKVHCFTCGHISDVSIQ